MLGEFPILVKVISAVIDVPGDPVPLDFNANSASSNSIISNLNVVSLTEVNGVFPLKSETENVVEALISILYSPAAGYGKFVLNVDEIAI